jgi:hypothetical protein
MTDRLKDLPQEIIDTFFNGSSQDTGEGEISKKAFFIVLSLLALSLVLSAIIIILYIIPYKQKTAAFKEAAASENSRYTEHLVKGGLINRESIEEVRFEGDAGEKSAFLKNSIELISSGSPDKASLVMKFTESTDLGGKNILIIARAKHGTKKMRLTLKDSRSRFYERPAIEFSPNWSLRHVYLDKTEGVDLKSIEELRLEFDSTIYLKDITVRGGM